MIDDGKRCTATSKRTGERCKRPVVPGYRVCYYHGANPKNHGGCPPEKAKGNLNGMTHGAYVERILNKDEQRHFDAIVARLRKDFVLNDSSDGLAVEALAMAFIRYCRAMKDGNADAAERLDRIVRAHLKDLKATKIAREGEGQEIKTTPADWATALLEKVHEAGKQPGRKARKKRKKAADAPRTPEKPQI